MVKHQSTDSEIIPGFDPVKWKRERQAQILEETRGMRPSEVREYFRRGSEKFREEQRRRRTAANKK